MRSLGFIQGLRLRFRVLGFRLLGVEAEFRAFERFQGYGSGVPGSRQPSLLLSQDQAYSSKPGGWFGSWFKD